MIGNSQKVFVQRRRQDRHVFAQDQSPSAIRLSGESSRACVESEPVSSPFGDAGLRCVLDATGP